MGAGVHEIAVLKIFKITKGATERRLSLVKLKTWFFQLFWRWTSPLSLIWNLGKLVLGKRLCFNILQGITVLSNRLVLVFCETNLIIRKRVFRRSFQWNVQLEHLALTAWKKKYFSIVCIVSVRYVQTEDCKACLHETLIK